MRTGTRSAALLAVAAIVGLTAVAASQRTQAQPRALANEPRTLLETHGPIVGLAQDAAYLAWMAGDLDCLDAVRSRHVSRGPVLTLDTFTGVCYATQTNPAVMAVARRRALWTAFDIGGNHGYGNVWVDGVGSQGAAEEPVRVQELLWDYVEHGEFATDAAGDYHLVYSTAEVTHTYDDDQDACDAAADCRYSVTGGGVFRVAGAKRVPIPNTTPALMLAVSGTRLALVAASRTRTAKRPSAVLAPTANSTVEVRNALNGELVSRFSPGGGRILALGLSDRFVAVLNARRHVEIRDARTGRLLRSVAVHPKTGQLGISGSTVVLATGTALSALDAATGRVRSLAAVKNPIGLSIEGRRIVWAENVSANRARIKALELG